MRRSPLPAAALAVVLALLAACGESPSIATPRGPLRADVIPSGQTKCLRTDATYLQQQINTVFKSGVRATARTLQRQVETQCASATPTVAMLDFVDSILVWRAGGNLAVANSSQPLWDYLTRLFKYTGYTIDNGIGALGPQGAIAMCDDRGPGLPNTTLGALACPIIQTDARTSGAAFFDGALYNDRYLVTIAPAPCGPAGATTNLRVYGQCVEVSADPKSTKTFTFNPEVSPTGGIVQTCIAHTAPGYLLPAEGHAPRVARLAQKSANDDRVRVRAVAPQLFETLDACNDAVVVTEGPTRPDARSGLTRLAALARGALGLLGPRVAYAGHGGLGTLPGYTEGSLSLFGPIDQSVFFGSFEPDVVGREPAVPTDGSLRGTWSIDTPSPGDVTVRASLGDIASQLAVINQAGGNATGKPGLEFAGVLAPSTTPGAPYPFEGTYTVSFRALVASPRAFVSPFVVRGSAREEIARITFRDGPNAQSGPIDFTVGNRTFPAGKWVQNVSRAFEFVIDFQRDRVSLRVDGGVVPACLPADVGSTALVECPLTSPNLERAGWSITDRDGQIIGMDDLVFARLPDVPR